MSHNCSSHTFHYSSPFGCDSNLQRKLSADKLNAIVFQLIIIKWENAQIIMLISVTLAVATYNAPEYTHYFYQNVPLLAEKPTENYFTFTKISFSIVWYSLDVYFSLNETSRQFKALTHNCCNSHSYLPNRIIECVSSTMEDVKKNIIWDNLQLLFNRWA